ncbi:MAG: penicillin-insensitive murein endopeptidase [Candidatus Alcyoniella australis]|nr:penicillin-insensitive murein endopeptidase [Candidatus Alcyoniella australis]
MRRLLLIALLSLLLLAPAVWAEEVASDQGESDESTSEQTVEQGEQAEDQDQNSAQAASDQDSLDELSINKELPPTVEQPPKAIDVSQRVPMPEGVCMSWGAPSNGLLINGVQFPDGPGYFVRRSHHDFSTPELISAVLYAIETVQVTYPGTHDIYIGDLSAPGGGSLRPHVSHENGRDIDIGLYFSDGSARGHFVTMNEGNLDVPKTWTLIEAMIENGKVQYIFLDYSLQSIFYAYCRDNLKKSAAFLETVFQYPRGRRVRQGIIRHSRGHHNHLHVRFYCPNAVAAADGFTPTQTDFQLARQGRMIGSGSQVDYEPGSARPRQTASYSPSRRAVASSSVSRRVKRDGPSLIYVVAEGDSLSTISSRFLDPAVTSSNIRAWNGLSRSKRLYPGQSLVVYTSEVPPLPEREPSIEQMVADNSELVMEQAVHNVESGDSLWTISRRFNCRMSDLCLWNKIKPSDKLQIGQVLIVKRVTRKLYASLELSYDAQVYDESDPVSSFRPLNQLPYCNQPCN